MHAILFITCVCFLPSFGTEEWKNLYSQRTPNPDLLVPWGAACLIELATHETLLIDSSTFLGSAPSLCVASLIDIQVSHLSFK